MSTIGRTATLILALAFGVWPGSGRAVAADAPAAVVSISPLHSLVAAVMAGVGEPVLLVKGAASPHTAALRPSDAAALQRADVVFWVGEDLETFLAKPLAALPTNSRVVAMATAPGMTLLPARQGGPWEAHDHGHAHADDSGHGHDDAHAHEAHADEAHANDDGEGGDGHGPHEGQPMDMHVWLDPENAKAMATAAAAVLGEVDPGRAETYAANVRALHGRLDALDAELRGKLAGVADKPYVVFHDAYQYFEARYGLSPAGAITISPERAPGARTLSEIRERIRSTGAVCVFREPQFEPDLVKTVVGGSFARVGILDPIGADIPPGPEAYEILLSQLGRSLRDCLGR